MMGRQVMMASELGTASVFAVLSNTENSIRVDNVIESPTSVAMIALFCLCLALFALPFTSKGPT